MINCDTLYEAIYRSLPLDFSCASVNDTIAVRTPLMFPDGDFIIVYIEEAGGKYVVTDAGTLWGFLLANGIPPKLSFGRQQILDDVLLINTTHMEDDEVRTSSSFEGLSFAIFRVAQAVARASGIIYSRRIAIPDTFNTTVADFFDERHISYQEEYPIVDVYEKQWVFDFRIQTGKHKLVKTLATDSPSYAESLVSRAVRQWDGFSDMIEQSCRITIYNDMVDVWRTESLRQIKAHSELIPFSESEHYIDLLLAK
jgi:hypothetical protein